MNLKNLIASSFALFLIVGFIACTKQQSSKTPKTQERFLTDAQVSQIGSLHNLYLSKLFTSQHISINALSTNSNSQRVQSLQLALKDVSTPGVTEEQKDSLISQPQMSIDSIKTLLTDPLASAIIDEATSDLNNLQDVTSFSAQITGLQGEARATLNGSHLDIILVYLEVMNNSVYFWSPSDVGGSGEGNNILASLRGKKTVETLITNKASSTTKRIIAPDAAVAAASLITSAFAAVGTGPIAPVSFFVLVGVGAAFSSGLSALHVG
jgi:hypothetical protein